MKIQKNVFSFGTEFPSSELVESCIKACTKDGSIVIRQRVSYKYGSGFGNDTKIIIWTKKEIKNGN